MAIECFTQSQTLPQTNGNSVSFTSSGFGTVSWALLFFTIANTTNNPQDGAVIGIAIWDGTNDRSISGSSAHNVDLSDTNRYMDTNGVWYGISGLEYSITATTDGITVTKDSGSTGVDRYCSAVCFKGFTNLTTGTMGLGTGTSQVNQTVTGTPNFGLFLNISSGTQDSEQTTLANSFGVAYKDGGGTIHEGCVMFGEEHNADISNNYTLISSTACCGQLFNNTKNWDASCTDLSSANLGITPSASADSDDILYLTATMPADDDCHIEVVDARTTTGVESYTGHGYTPVFASFASENSTALDTSSVQLSVMFSITDGTTTLCQDICSEDNVDITNTESERTTNLIRLKSHSGTVNGVATLDGLVSGGVDADFTTAPGSAYKMLLWTFGDSTAGAATKPRLLPLLGVG